MQRTMKPKTAGVLMIMAGCYMFLLLAPMLFVGGGMYGTYWKLAIFWASSLVIAIIGLLGLIGGISALRRKGWRLVFAVCVCAILASLIFTAVDTLILESGTSSAVSMIMCLIPAVLAIAALIFLVLSRKEFMT